MRRSEAIRHDSGAAGRPASNGESAPSRWRVARSPAGGSQRGRFRPERPTGRRIGACLRCLSTVGLLAGGLTAFEAGAQTHYLPKGTNLTSLVVITHGALGSLAHRVLFGTLQGHVARRSGTQIYIQGVSAGYGLWHHHLHDAYGIPHTTVSSPWTVLDQFKHLVAGYVLYDLAGNSNSLSAATALCAPLNAVAVDVSIEATVRSHGLTNLLADVRTRNEAWVWTNHPATFSSNMVVELKESLGANLRDYATLAGAFTFYDGNSAFRSQVMRSLAPDAACLGWGDASGGEDEFVSRSSSDGVHTLPADLALNLSTLSSVRDLTVCQHTFRQPVAESNVHYATFITTDGDNVQYNVGGFPGHYQLPPRGQFNMGWALSPSLADLAPSLLRWYFDAASNGVARDFFVAGPSGTGYFYPSRYPSAELEAQVVRLNEFLARADLNIAQILDFDAFPRLDLWNRYLAQPALDALLYLEYSRYNRSNGAVLFSAQGKPIISARDMLWGGLQEEASVIAHLNSYPRDPSSPEGYTFVTVHVWSKNLSNVQTVVNGLLPDVRVVTPHEFVRLVRDHVGRRLSYGFTLSAEGWQGGTGGRTYDKAQWYATEGNPGGRLLLDGSDFGNPDPAPNSWFRRQIILPANAATLGFDTKANNDGRLRVRLQRADGSYVTLLDWETLPAPDVWVARSADLTGFAGETVTLAFEQNDGGQGSGEHRHLDNVRVLTDGPPLYTPDSPRLLDLLSSNEVHLSWRDNDAGHPGFRIERRDGSGGEWVAIASLPAGTTRFSDAGIVPGQSYRYRVRACNAAGCSPPSNERSVAVPPRPALTLHKTAQGVVANWPAWAADFVLYSATQLEPTARWSFVTNSPVLRDGFWQVGLTADGNWRYFRLQKP